MKYKRYKKDFNYSYTLGIFLTIELLIHKPKQVMTVYLSPKANLDGGVGKIIELCQQYNIEVETNDKMINSLSPKENCYVVGVFNKYQETLDCNSNHIVLVNPSDSGNLGTIIRTSLGFGINNIAIIKPAVDIFDPKTIRSSMGALFNISYTYYEDFTEYLTQNNNHDIYPFMLKAEKMLHEVNINRNKPFSLTFGNEASGLDDSFLNIGMSVKINHLNTIDSLNLSIATGIAIYEFTKQYL